MLILLNRHEWWVSLMIVWVWLSVSKLVTCYVNSLILHPIDGNLKLDLGHVSLSRLKMWVAIKLLHSKHDYCISHCFVPISNIQLSNAMVEIHYKNMASKYLFPDGCNLPRHPQGPMESGSHHQNCTAVPPGSPLLARTGWSTRCYSCKNVSQWYQWI